MKNNLQSKDCCAIEGACKAAGIGRVVEGIGVLAMLQAAYCLLSRWMNMLEVESQDSQESQ